MTRRSALRASEAKWWTTHFDGYDMYMQAGYAGELGRLRGLEQLGFWRKILAPFLARHLKQGATGADIPPVTAFETGTNDWRRLPAWPAGCESGCTAQPTPLYLAAGLRLCFAAPVTSSSRLSLLPEVTR